MPIQINELVVRATVEPDAGEERGQTPPPEFSRAQVVAECVEQVLEILRQREER